MKKILKIVPNVLAFTISVCVIFFSLMLFSTDDSKVIQAFAFVFLGAVYLLITVPCLIALFVKGKSFLKLWASLSIFIPLVQINFPKLLFVKYLHVISFLILLAYYFYEKKNTSTDTEN